MTLVFGPRGTRLPLATALLTQTTWSTARFFHGRISPVAAAVSGPKRAHSGR